MDTETPQPDTTPFGEPAPQDQPAAEPEGEQPTAEETPPAPEASADRAPDEDQPDEDQPDEDQPDEDQEVDRGAGAYVRRVEVGSVEGDLIVRGTDEPHVRINAHDLDDEEPVQTSEGVGGVLRIARLSGHAELVVPRGTAVSVRHLDGDLHAEDLGGGLTVGSIEGDTTLMGVATADLSRVDGDLHARACGLVRAPEVSGDMRLDDLRGVAELGRIAGDLEAYQILGLRARSIGGDMQIEGCAGEVSIRGPVGGDLHASGCAGELHVGTVGGDLLVRLCRAVAVDGTVRGDCDLAEVTAGIEIRGTVAGDLRASLVGGLSVEGTVGGDVDLTTIARATRLLTVGGDLRAEGLAGPLAIETIGGDADLSTCLGPIRIHMVGGDLDIQNATGGVALARVGGDVNLDTPLAAGAEYQVRAAGDIHLRVRGEVSARFVAQTIGGEIRTRLPLAVERGRRRNLVGVLGRGDAAVTLHSDGGDISIVGVYGNQEDGMSDEFTGTGTDTAESGTGTSTSANPRTWEGNFGGHKFRVRWDPGAQTATQEPGAPGSPRRGFGFEWEHDPAEDRKTSEDFERRLNDLRDKAEQTARRAAEQAQRYAERAARRARETDWESVGREVRSAIERAMSELEDTVNQFRRDFETRRGPGASGPGSSSTGAQRVRIEHDEEGAADGAGPSAEPSAGATSADAENRRRAILEDLRAGIISIDEAERRLGELR